MNWGTFPALKLPYKNTVPRQEKHPSPPPVIIVRKNIKGKRACAPWRCSRFIILQRVSLILSLCKLFVSLIKKNTLQQSSTKAISPHIFLGSHNDAALISPPSNNFHSNTTASTSFSSDARREAICVRALGKKVLLEGRNCSTSPQDAPSAPRI